MKKKDLQSLRNKDVKELGEMVREARSALSTINLDMVQNKIKNTKTFFEKRKEIAQILTIMREKELVA